uniref:Uncharacterized protein n=1 Tax=Arundo donax TaxID=35708 RepID=A0A0A9BL75_ARUDO
MKLPSTCTHKVHHDPELRSPNHLFSLHDQRHYQY